MIRSLRFRITAWYAGLLAAALLLFGASTYVGLQHYLYSNLQRTLASDCRAIETQLLAQVPFQGPAWLTEEINEAFAPEVNGHFIRVTQEGRGTVYVSGTPKNNRFDPSRIPLPADATPLGFRKLHQPGSESLLVVNSRYTSSDGNRFVVESGISDRQIRVALNGLLLTFALYVPFLVLLAVISGYWLMRRSLRPVDEVTEKAQSITATNLGERLPVIRTGDELERLSTALNRMIERLDLAFENVHRFSADASHELRTPLTILQLELEGLAQNPRLDPSLADQIGSALEETARMSHIVENLLTISRLDAGQLKMAKARIDLGQLASSTTDQMKLLADEKSINLHCEQTHGLIVEGDRSRLQQVIVNILDNAIKYTQPKGAIEVNVGQHGNSGVLEVRDNGPGIPADATPHLFERFFRVDKGRSRELGGAGLGLAIAKAICTAHGAEISVSSVEGGGTRFTVAIPLCAVSLAEQPAPSQVSF